VAVCELYITAGKNGTYKMNGVSCLDIRIIHINRIQVLEYLQRKIIREFNVYIGPSRSTRYIQKKPFHFHSTFIRISRTSEIN